MAGEKKAADEIKNRGLSVRKLALQYRFVEAIKQLNSLIAFVGNSNALAGANPSVDDADDEWAYPPEYQSRYLLNVRSDETMNLIGGEALKYKCECNPLDCECSYGQHKTNHNENVHCDFCNEIIADGELIVILDISGKKMCSTCDGFFERIAFPEFSAGKAVDVLINDAVIEASPPWYQFEKCHQFLEMAKLCCLQVSESNNKKSGF